MNKLLYVICSTLLLSTPALSQVVMSNIHEGNFVTNAPVTIISGIVAGDILVSSGTKAIVSGTVSGDVRIERDAHADISGIIDGNVIHEGTATVTGIVSGRVVDAR